MLKILPASQTRARVWQLGPKRELVVKERPNDLVEISGVPGRFEPAVDVIFLGDDPETASSGTSVPLLPTGNTTDVIKDCPGSPRVILIAQPNPTIFVFLLSTPRLRHRLLPLNTPHPRRTNDGNRGYPSSPYLRPPRPRHLRYLVGRNHLSRPSRHLRQYHGARKTISPYNDRNRGICAFVGEFDSRNFAF